MMNFCLCENSKCICKTSCTCIHRGCLCAECHDIRQKDGCKECSLQSTRRELVKSAPDVGTCKCEISSRLQTPSQEIFSPSTSDEVANENTKDSETSISKSEPTSVDLLRISSNQTLIPTEQEMKPMQDIGANKSHQPAMSSTSNVLDKQIYKCITVFAEQALYSTDDSETSSDEITVAEEAFDYLSRRGGHQQSDTNQSNSGKISTSSPSERVELPSSESSSGVSILDPTENKWGPCSQTEPHSFGNQLAIISSLKMSPDQIGNLGLQRPESTSPSVILGERIRDDASLGGSVSPIQVITTNPRTVLVSYSGELHLLPSPTSQSLLRPPVNVSHEIRVPQSADFDKASSSPAVEAPSTTLPPKNIHNSEKPQTE